MGYLSAETLDVSGGGGTFTVPSGCTFLLVKLAVSTGTAPTSVTLGGTAVTTVATRDNTDSLACGVYSRVSPAIGSLTLAFSSVAAYAKATLEYYDGIDSVRGSSTAGGSFATSFSLGVTSVAGDLCSDFIVIQENATATAGGSQTLIVSTTFAVTPKMYAASRQTATGTTTTFAWTTNGAGQRQAHIAIALVPIQNAPKVDAAFVTVVAGSSTLSVTVAANNNRVLYFYTDNAATSVSRDGQALTDVSGDGGVWRVIAPNTGTANVVAVGTTGSNPLLMALSLYDADQTTPERGALATRTTFTGPWTSAVTSATDDLVVDLGAVIGNTFSTTAAGQTARINTQLAAPASQYYALSSTRTATGTSTDMSWTGSSITGGFLYLFAVRAVSAAAGNTPAFGRYRIAGARR